MQQFLQGAPVVQAAAHFGHQRFGNVKGEAAPREATVEDVAGVLFSGKAGGTMFADTRTAPQIQGAEGSGPEAVNLPLKPALPIGRRLRFRLHGVRMTHNTYISRTNFL